MAMKTCQCGFEFTQDMIDMDSICPKCNFIPRERRYSVKQREKFTSEQTTL